MWFWEHHVSTSIPSGRFWQSRICSAHCLILTCPATRLLSAHSHYALFFNLHTLCLTFSFQNFLVTFQFLFRYFDDRFLIDAFKCIFSDGFLCQECGCNLNRFQVLASRKSICTDCFDVFTDRYGFQFFISFKTVFRNGCYSINFFIYSHCCRDFDRCLCFRIWFFLFFEHFLIFRKDATGSLKVL